MDAQPPGTWGAWRGRVSAAAPPARPRAESAPTEPAPAAAAAAPAPAPAPAAAAAAPAEAAPAAAARRPWSLDPPGECVTALKDFLGRGV